MFKLIFTCVLDTFLYPGNFDNLRWLSDKTQVNVRVSPYGWFVNCVTFWCGGFKLAVTVLKAPTVMLLLRSAALWTHHQGQRCALGLTTSRRAYSNPYSHQKTTPIAT